MSAVWVGGLDGESKWSASFGKTEVMFNGWHENDLGQQRDDGEALR